ncbi:hypothetical protein ABZZ80_38525, partial [Streptomyces sp. NPDC006356]
MPNIAVTTWSLEQTAPTDLLPAQTPEGDVKIVCSEVPSPEFSRFLYASVGGRPPVVGDPRLDTRTLQMRLPLRVRPAQPVDPQDVPADGRVQKPAELGGRHLGADDLHVALRGLG